MRCASTSTGTTRGLSSWLVLIIVATASLLGSSEAALPGTSQNQQQHATRNNGNSNSNGNGNGNAVEQRSRQLRNNRETLAPTPVPAPSSAPTDLPSQQPSQQPSVTPSQLPTPTPTTATPTLTGATLAPTVTPATPSPTMTPTVSVVVATPAPTTTGTTSNRTTSTLEFDLLTFSITLQGAVQEEEATFRDFLETYLLETMDLNLDEEEDRILQVTLEPSPVRQQERQRQRELQGDTRLDYIGVVVVVVANPSQLTQEDVQDAQIKTLEDTSQLQASLNDNASDNDNTDPLLISQVQLQSRDAVSAINGGDNGNVPSITPVDDDDDDKNSSGLIVGLVVALVLIVVGIGLLVYQRKHRKPPPPPPLELEILEEADDNDDQHTLGAHSIEVAIREKTRNNEVVPKSIVSKTQDRNGSVVSSSSTRKKQRLQKASAEQVLSEGGNLYSKPVDSRISVPPSFTVAAIQNKDSFEETEMEIKMTIQKNENAEKDTTPAVLNLTRPSERNPQGFQAPVVVTPPPKPSPPPPSTKQQAPPQQQPMPMPMPMQTPPRATPTEQKQQQLQPPSPSIFDEDELVNRTFNSTGSNDDESMAGFSLATEAEGPDSPVRPPTQQISLSQTQNKWLLQMPTTTTTVVDPRRPRIDSDNMYISDSETTQGTSELLPFVEASMKAQPPPTPQRLVKVGNNIYTAVFADDDDSSRASSYNHDADISSDPMVGLLSGTDVDSDADDEDMYTTSTSGSILNISSDGGIITSPLRVRKT